MKRYLSLAIALLVVFAASDGGFAAAKKNPPPKPATKTTFALPRLLELGADRCIPCKMMRPIIDELTTEYQGRVRIEFIDVWKNPDAADQYRIRSIPTQVFFDRTGKEVFRHIGFYSKEAILKQFDAMGIK